MRAQPVFEAVKWAGAAYLTFLGAQAIRSAIRGRYEPSAGGQPAVAARPFAGWRQGFLLSNPATAGRPIRDTAWPTAVHGPRSDKQ